MLLPATGPLWYIKGQKHIMVDDEPKKGNIVYDRFLHLIGVYTERSGNLVMVYDMSTGRPHLCDFNNLRVLKPLKG